MGSIVTGIVAADDAGIEAALQHASLPLEPLVVIAAEDASLSDVVPHPRGDILMGNTGTGTGVPGLTSRTRDLGPQSQPLPAHERLRERLGDLEIPDDEIENYLDALEAGRSVVGYVATPENAARVADIFRGCGVAKVKVS